MNAQDILDRAQIAYDVFAEQKRSCFAVAIFLDRNRNTEPVVCNTGNIEDTRAEIEELLAAGARPVCIQVLPIGQPLYLPVGDSLTVDDEAIIAGGFEYGAGGLGYRVILGYRDPVDSTIDGRSENG